MSSHDAIVDQVQPPFQVKPILIVGVGASAGGLDALEKFFARAPVDQQIAFVVVQHLSSNHRSMMDELLQRCTKMHVCYAEHDMFVEANTIYLLPPGKEITINQEKLKLIDKPHYGELSLPIDRFFSSLAQDVGTRGVAIVLSGTGSDGSRGVIDVHQAGGLTMAQTVESAKFDGMPRAAENTSVIDLILAPEEMPQALVRYADAVSRMEPGEQPSLTFTSEGAMGGVFRLLRSRYSLDFAQYKATTICRRIERRLLMSAEADLDSYAHRLESDPAELDLLYKDLLIGVTRFFRDNSAYEKLEDGLLPELLDRHNPEEEFRVWVAGCATGEEAYSVAILLHEEFERRRRPLNLKIFATDMHESSLTVASHGIYSKEALSDISEERLERYFKRTNTGYEVAAHLRTLIVFAPHNLTADPPFTNLALVTCRNLLIYLKPAAQRKVIALFHFGLKLGGSLWLGPSETLGELDDEFEVFDAKWRMYRKARDVRLSNLRTTLASTDPLPVSPPSSLPYASSGNQLLETYDRLLDEFMPPGFLIDMNRHLVHTFGGAGKYLVQRDGRPSLDVLDLLHPQIKPAFAAALQRLKLDRTPAVYTGIRCEELDGVQELSLTVRPFFKPKSQTTDVLVLLEPVLPRAAGDMPIETAPVVSTDELHALEAELRYTKETLQSTIEQLETTNEELQASNEELVASNEELQSTNEELHSVNEELYTVNAEHQRKITELTELTDDMDNLLASTDVQMLFLDEELRIRKFTPGVARTFSLIPQDIGRPVDNLTHNIDYEDLLTQMHLVLTSEQPFEKFVQDRRGNWYMLRILPYVTRHRTGGIVLTLFNVSDIKQAEARLAELSAIVEQSDEAIIRCDTRGVVTTWNRGAKRLFGYSSRTLTGRSIAELEPADRAGESAMLLRRVASGNVVEQFETSRLRNDGSIVDVSLSIWPLHDTENHHIGSALFVHDITQRKLAEAEIKGSVERRDQFLAMLSHELRNPLGAMLNATHLLEHLPQDQRKEKLDNVCRVIKRQGQQMGRLLDDLLDVSRVTQGKIELRKQLFDLRSITSEAIDVIQQQLVDRRIDMRLDTADKELPIYGDRSRILQVVENLLKNAVKYSPSDGRIWLDMHRKHEHAVISVRDTGVGIPQQHLPNVFDLFVQFHESLDRSEGGMGVGLTLVRSIIELHGGTVSVHSEGPGQGSEFVVRLPLSDSQVASPEQPQVEGTRAKRIVLVEDIADSREMLESLLRMQGCDVVSASDGPAGLSAITQHRPEIALVDIGLPAMDGYDVARAVRKNQANNDVYLVALTGYGQSQDRQFALEAGFDEHLVKPLQAEQLQWILRQRRKPKTAS